jgi:glycosyltransferase involved in cell wall biosynthesis
MPSYIENSPNNLCEAMILGMPCVATFAGGTGSLLKDGEEGILIQDGDPYVLAGAILELKNYPEKAVEMSQKARASALKRHNVESVTEQYLNIYREIIENNQK